MTSFADLVGNVNVQNGIEKKWNGEREQMGDDLDSGVRHAQTTVHRAHAVGEVHPLEGDALAEHQLVDVHGEAEDDDDEKKGADRARLEQFLHGERPSEGERTLEREKNRDPERGRAHRLL